jgi:HEAT repeat protein
MKSKARIFVLVSAATLTGVVIWFYQHRGNETASNQSRKASSMPALKPNQTTTQPVQDQKTKVALQMLANGIKNMGWKEVPPAQDSIQQAIASKDSGEILRAFHEAIYSQGSRMADSIPAIKTFLNDPDPWVRYQAAEKLYIAGDNSGFEALVDLLQTDHSLRDYDGGDIRTRAAQTLEKYRDKRAINALIDYDQKSHNDWVVTGLAQMMGVDLPSNLVQQIKS